MSIAFVLAAPQMGENIGATARVMANFGLNDLRLVSPRDGWPNPKALETARGAAYVIESAKLFHTMPEALHDRTRVFAVTARLRDVPKPVLTPEDAVHEALRTGNAAFLFGRESSGLTNAEVDTAAALVTIPTDTRYASLNLSQAAGVLAYQIFRASGGALPPSDHVSAPWAELEMLIRTTEGFLERTRFYRSAEKKEQVRRRLETFLRRTDPDSTEIRLLTGVIKALGEYAPLEPPAPGSPPARPAAKTEEA